MEAGTQGRGAPAIPKEELLQMYEQMLRIRIFEEQVNELYTSGKMPGLAHLYIGEEAVAVGVCRALRRDDYITSTHRGHGHCLAKGALVNLMFAELLGKAAGYCHGKGGSMHIADPETGNLGANAIVGGSTAIAVGAALSAKMRGTDQVVACFFGEADEPTVMSAITPPRSTSASNARGTRRSTGCFFIAQRRYQRVYYGA